MDIFSYKHLLSYHDELRLSMRFQQPLVKDHHNLQWQEEIPGQGEANAQQLHSATLWLQCAEKQIGKLPCILISHLT